MARRLVLVKPPEQSRFNFGAFSLATVAAGVRDRLDVAILDATLLSQAQAVQQTLALRPDIVGVTAMGLLSVNPVTEFLKATRAVFDGLLLAGGHGSTLVPDLLLAAGADAVVMGEGENTLREIVDTGLFPGMAGVAMREGGATVIGPTRPPLSPLGLLPVPARDLMPAPPDGVHLMETSRGCPHACAFCETTRFHGRRWRPHEPSRVAAEVKDLVERWDAWTIHFSDDNFAASSQRVLEICKILKRGPLPAMFMASARGDDLVAEPRLIPAMAEARILRVSVGVETLEPDGAHATGKSISTETYREAFKRMRKAGIFSVASFIVGIPGEAADAVEQALDRAIDVACDSAHFLPFLPLPGTPLAEGRPGMDPLAVDVRNAELLNAQFRRHPLVLKRLKQAAEEGGVRGLLAKATISRYTQSA